MERLNYIVKVNAPVHTVWATMLSAATYREWTSAFLEGSYYEGDWTAGSEMCFLGPDGEGSLGGMIATVEENRTNEFISLRYLGQVMNGVYDTTSDAAKRISGAHENYSFIESGGVTTVEVEVDSDDEFTAMFNATWPVALAKLRDISESLP